MDLRCEILASEDEAFGLAVPWRTLHERVGLSPFTDFDYALSWWRIIGKPSGAQLRVVCCYDGDALVGLIPFSIRKTGPVRILRLLGHEAYYYRTFLAETPSVSEKLWDAALNMPGYDMADIKNIHAETPEAALFASRGRLLEATRIFHRELSGQTRETIFASFSRRLRRLYERARDEVRNDPALALHTACCHEIVPEVIDFLVARKREWVVQTGKRGLFRENETEAFFQEMTRIAAGKGSLLSYWITRHDKPVAAVLCIIEKGILYGHTVAHDPSIGKIAPGLFLNAEALLWASDHGLREKNFMEGQEDYKQRFTKTERTMFEYTYTPTLLGGIFLFAYRTLLALRKRGGIIFSKA